MLAVSGKESVDKAGVLGVRCHGDIGTRRLGFEAPGLARPACSRCSTRAKSAYQMQLSLRCRPTEISYHLTTPARQQ